MFKTTPAVFAAGENYHIMVPVSCQVLMWAKVGDEEYYDEDNGIMRSDVDVHRMIVPKDELDKARKYTICVRKIIERKPYFTETEDAQFFDYEFKPVEGENVRAYHISDAHSMVDLPVSAAKAYGDIDFLILNGDIPNHSGDVENIFTVYEIIEKLTAGKIPVVFARGNHDMRGVCAEHFAEWTPNNNGATYYTFRLGNIWGLILDCGEDKLDTSNEYGYTVSCHAFRKRQTKFIKSVIENAEKEYNADGVKHKLIISHHPFTKKMNEPFNIEEDTYTEWAKLIKDNIKPDVMICGHLHKLAIFEVGSEEDAFGQPCKVVIGSHPLANHLRDTDETWFKGTGFSFENDKIEATFTKSTGEILEKHII